MDSSAIIPLLRSILKELSVFSFGCLYFILLLLFAFVWSFCKQEWKLSSLLSPELFCREEDAWCGKIASLSVCIQNEPLRAWECLGQSQDNGWTPPPATKKGIYFSSWEEGEKTRRSREETRWWWKSGCSTRLKSWIKPLVAERLGDVWEQPGFAHSCGMSPTSLQPCAPPFQ